MNTVNFDHAAELYLGRDWQTAQALGARSFGNAAKAIRFAVEDVAPCSLHGALLIIDGNTFSASDMKALYDSEGYPLPRKRTN